MTCPQLLVIYYVHDHAVGTDNSIELVTCCGTYGKLFEQKLPNSYEPSVEGLTPLPESQPLPAGSQYVNGTLTQVRCSKLASGDTLVLNGCDTRLSRGSLRCVGQQWLFYGSDEESEGVPVNALSCIETSESVLLVTIICRHFLPLHRLFLNKFLIYQGNTAQHPIRCFKRTSRPLMQRTVTDFSLVTRPN